MSRVGKYLSRGLTLHIKHTRGFGSHTRQLRNLQNKLGTLNGRIFTEKYPRFLSTSTTMDSQKQRFGEFCFLNFKHGHVDIDELFMLLNSQA